MRCVFLQIWYGAVLRGDKNKIKVGRLTNVQDRAVISTVANLNTGFPANVEIGDSVSGIYSRSESE